MTSDALLDRQILATFAFTGEITSSNSLYFANSTPKLSIKSGWEALVTPGIKPLASQAPFRTSIIQSGVVLEHSGKSGAAKGGC